MIFSSLALILLLVGGQTAVVPDPPGGPGKEYVFPIGDDGPGGGGGGGGGGGVSCTGPTYFSSSKLWGYSHPTKGSVVAYTSRAECKEAMEKAGCKV